MFVKLGLVLGGATLAAVAHCIELSHEKPSIWTVCGLVGAALVFVGGAYMAMTEQDVGEALETARQAVDKLRDDEHQIEQYKKERVQLRKESNRGLNLYTAMDGMRGAIEQSLDQDVPPQRYLKTLLETSRNALEVAFDFSIADSWTICIFKADANGASDKKVLRLVAHLRKLHCEITTAREWEEGVGVAGIAYSTGNDITIPDLLAPELGSTFDLKENSRPYDAQRYRSVVAVPIEMNPDAAPWGVVVITIDKPGHFDLANSQGIATYEPAHAIAAMAALAVKTVGRERLDSPLPSELGGIASMAEVTQSPEPKS